MKNLFIIGLFLQTLAQFFFSHQSVQNYLAEPIDFIHWTLLIGFVLVIPYIVQFSTGWFQKIGATFSMIGLICLICMCAIDFVLWSFRHMPEERNEIIGHIMNEPMIWPIFFTIGPAFYYTGMSIQTMAYLKSNWIPASIVIVGATLVGLGGLILSEYRVIFMIGKILFAASLIYLCLSLSPNWKNKN